MHFILRLLINAAALWVATRLVPGITYRGPWYLLMGVALVFGVLNASVRPLLKLLTFPLLILTLGLFTFVTNALMLWLTSWVSGLLGLGFHVDDFWPAFLGALVVSVVSLLLSIFVSDHRPVLGRMPSTFSRIR
jgi:putative membrane protein